MQASSVHAWGTAVLVAGYAGFAAVSLLLAVIDIRTHRLPNRIVLPAYPVAIALFLIGSVLRGDPTVLLRAVAGALLLFAFYLALRLIQPAGMGGGDVKLAGLTGLFLAGAGWDALIVGVFAGFAAGGLFSVVLLGLRRAHRRTRVAFGPWMLLGTWVGILATFAAR